MPNPTTSTPADPPPSPGHLRPPKPPEVRPPPSKANLGSLTPGCPSWSETPSPELRPPLAGISTISDTPHLVEVEDEDKELLENTLARDLEQVSDDSASSLDFSEDDRSGEDGAMEEDECLPKDEAFRKLMNEALIELRREQEEIRAVDAILGEVEREKASKGKEVLHFPMTSPTAGVPIPASSPVGRGQALGGTPLAECSNEEEGIACSNPHQRSLNPLTSPITSLPSITSTFPSKPPFSNSNTMHTLSPSFIPSSSSPPLASTSPLVTGSRSNPTGLTGQTLTSQTLTGQPLTNFKSPSSSRAQPPLPNPSAKGGQPDQGPAIKGQSRSQASTTPWIDLVKASSSRMELKFVAPTLNEKGLLALEDGTSKEGELFWKNTLVGYSIDRRLPFKIVQQRLWMLWGKFGIKDIRVNKEGFYLFTFTTEEGARGVLSSGPWVVFGQQLFLKAWKRNFDFCKEEFKTIPNWVKFYGIPTTYWSTSGFSAIASRIGIPLYTDELTSSAKLLDFARICVEMKVGSDFPTSFKVQSEFNEEFEIRVEYSWRPRQCTLCNVFGHSTSSCPKNTSKNPTLPLAKTTLHSAKQGPPRPRQIYQPKNQTTTNLGPSLTPTISHNSSPPVLPCSNSFATLVDDQDVGNSGTNGELAAPTGVETIEGHPGLGDSSAPPKDIGQQASPPNTPRRGTKDLDGVQGASDKLEGSLSPLLWGHKVKMVDELDRRNKKTIRKSALRKKKRIAAAGGTSPKGLQGAGAPSSST